MSHMRNQSFKDVPVDSDTRIIGQKEVRIGGIDALCQCWIWDGIKGWSMVFFTNDVQDLSDDELVGLVREVEVITTSTTIKRGEKWTFVNFNFRIQ